MEDANPSTTPPNPQSMPKRPDHHGPAVEHKFMRKRGPLRRLGRWLVAIVLLLVLLVVLAPVLLNTSPGTRLLTRIAGPRIGGTLEIDDLRLSWLGGQRATGIRYKQDGGKLSAEIGDFTASDLSLLDLVTGSRNLGSIELDNVLVIYAQPDPTQQPDEPGTSEPGDSTPPPDPSQPAKPLMLPRGLAFTVAVRGFDLRYRAADLETVKVISAVSTVSMAGGKDIELDLKAAVQQGARTGSFELVGKVSDLADANGVFQPRLADYQLTAEARDLPVDGIGRVLADQKYANPAAAYLLGRRGRFAAVVGGQDLTAKLALDGVPSHLEATLLANTQNVEINLPLRRDGNTLVISPESKLRWDMTPAGFKALFAKSGLTLNQTMRFESRRIEATLPRDGGRIDLDRTSLAVILVGGDTTLTDPLGREIEVTGVRVGVNSKSLTELVAGRFEATVTAPDETGQMVAGAVQVDLAGRQLFKPTREINFVSEKLPIVLIDALGGMDDNLVLWLGSTLDMDVVVRGQLVEDGRGSRVVYAYSLLPESSRVSGELPGEIDGTRVTAATHDQQPVEVTLRADGFAKLMSMMSGDPEKPLLRFAADQSMTAYVTINRLMYAPDLKGAFVNGRFRPEKPELNGLDLKIELTPATVVDPRNRVTYQLRSGVITVKAASLDEPLEFKSEFDLWVPPDAGRAGFGAALTLQTTVFDLLDTTGKLPLTGPELTEQIRLDGGIGLEKMPSDLFDSLLQRDGDLAAVLGPVVDDLDVKFDVANGKPTGATIRLNWDERINAPIDGAWASMRPLQLDIDDSGMMTIADGKDVTLELRVHPELGNRWMGRLHPILFDAKSGDRPVQVTVKGDTFRFPLGAEGMKGANVEAMVDLGSLEFGSDALLGRLLSWTGHAGDRAVFNPARVRLVDGQISYEQLDLSVGNVQLRFDGKLDLNSGQIVDMAMRVPGSSLVRVFGELEGVVPKDDFLSIPMSGSIREPKFDRTLIAREVTRLLTENAIRQQRDRLQNRILEEAGVEEGSVEADLVSRGLEILLGGGRRRLENKDR